MGDVMRFLIIINIVTNLSLLMISIGTGDGFDAGRFSACLGWFVAFLGYLGDK